jgi:biotin synthase
MAFLRVRILAMVCVKERKNDMNLDNPSKTDIESWLREEDAARLEALWRAADEVRRKNVGDEVHLRGLIEISNHCARLCGYCGLRADHQGLTRYRMTMDEILACAKEAVSFGYGTVVLQGGEDFGLTKDWVTNVICLLKAQTPLAVTLSLGERTDDELRAWRAAGADRYLLRFETSDPDLYRSIHPDLPGKVSDRLAILRRLRELDFEVGSGVMVGIPGQTYAILASDLVLFRDFDLDMIGVGPYLPHPDTPLGKEAESLALKTKNPDQVPNTELMTYKTVALTRLVRPDANIPSTTALATINKAQGRELGLMRGANIVMPNLTPTQYRAMYEIYPAKACIQETAAACRFCLEGRIASIGRRPGRGTGGRRGRR